MQLREVARQHDADLVGKDFGARLVDHAAAVAVAIEAEPHGRAALAHLVRHGVQHGEVFGIGIVAREGEIELGIHRHDLATDPLQEFGRKGAGGAVAAGGDNLDRSFERQRAREIVEVGLAEIGDVAIAPPSP